MEKLEHEPLFTNHQLVRLLWPLIIEQTLAILVGMSDTVMVLHRGKIMAQLPQKGAHRETVGLLMAGVEAQV